MAKRDSKPENDASDKTTPMPPEGSLPTAPPPQHEQLLKQYEGEIANYKRENAELQKRVDDLHRYSDEVEQQNEGLRATLEKLARDAEAPIAVAAANYRDPRCVERHTSSCVCTGEMRGPIS